MEKNQVMQIISNLLLVITIGVLIFTTITLIKNKDIIIKDPLTYGMGVHNFSECSCLDYNHKMWYSENGGFINREVNDAVKKDYDMNINISWFKGGQ